MSFLNILKGDRLNSQTYLGKNLQQFWLQIDMQFDWNPFQNLPITSNQLDHSTLGRKFALIINTRQNILATSFYTNQLLWSIHGSKGDGYKNVLVLNSMWSLPSLIYWIEYGKTNRQVLLKMYLLRPSPSFRQLFLWMVLRLMIDIRLLATHFQMLWLSVALGF
jgi:hypothetical protein